jgi:hypothetical protein
MLQAVGKPSEHAPQQLLGDGFCKNASYCGFATVSKNIRAFANTLPSRFFGSAPSLVASDGNRYIFNPSVSALKCDRFNDSAKAKTAHHRHVDT